jgi:ABC-type xylose transport system permease subunit
MSESTRTVLQVTVGVCFLLGLLLFLNETRSTGEAPETFKLIVSTSAASIVGGAVAVLALVAMLVLYFLERKRTLKHR